MRRLRYKILRGQSGDVSIALSLGGQDHLFSGHRAQQLMETLDEITASYIEAQMEEDAKKLSWGRGHGGMN